MIKIWYRTGKDGVKKAYILDKNGKSTLISLLKAKDFINEGLAKEVDPFWK